MSYKPGVCTFCGTGCAHLLKTDNGSVDGVFPVQNHPVSRGRLCVRGWNIHELLNTPERITTPLVKKDGALVPASYDEAIGVLVKGLADRKANAAEEIAVLASPRSSNEENYLLTRLARSVWGTNNITLDSDSGHRNSLDVLAAGTGMAGMTGSLEELRSCEYVLVAGIDITKQNPIIGSEIHYAVRSGATLVTVDSRKTQIARLSTSFLQARPGSNKIVYAAMAKILIEENLVDFDFLKKHNDGFEGFANSLGALRDEDISAKTGVSMDAIRAAARGLAAAKSAMVFFSSGISGLDADTISYIYNLFLIAGKVGRPGCGVNPIAGINNLQGGYDMGVAPDLLSGFRPITDAKAASAVSAAWGAPISAKPGRGVHELLESGASKLTALIVVDHDEGIVRHAERIKTIPFVAYIGAYKNPFMEYATVVLPIATYIEDDCTFTNTERRVQLSKKKADAPSGVLPGWKLLSAIAEKSGSKWSYASSAAVMDEIAKITPTYAGISHAKLEGTFGMQWPCDAKNPKGTARLSIEASKTFTFAPVSGSFEVPKPTGDFPSLLMIGKAQHFWHQNNIMRKTSIPLREYNTTLLLYPDGYVDITADEAKAAGVRDGWPVNVVSAKGAMRVQARVTDEVGPGAAYVPYFIQEMISEFLLENVDILKLGEDATIPVRIEKV